MKNPDDRIQTAHDLWLNLRWIAEGGPDNPSQVESRSASLPRKTAWIVAAALGFVFGGAVFWALRPMPAAKHVVTRFSYPLPEGQNFTRAERHLLALSPDGTRLAYVANQQLYLRNMDQLEAQPIRGTAEDPMEPVFSPDGQWLAYFVSGGWAGTTVRGWLRKIAVTGGAPVTLAQLSGAPYGLTWRDRMIVFGMNTTSVAGVQAVPDSGGTIQTLLTVDPGSEQVAQPELLADGKHIMFVSIPQGVTGSEDRIVVQSLDGKDRRTLVSAGSDPRVLPTGQLLYIHEGTLLAVPFDIKRLEVTGGPVPVLEDVAEIATEWAGQFAVSSDGALAFRPATGAAAPQRALIWIDRQGHEQVIPATPRAYGAEPRLSPDGTKIAIASNDEQHDIWVFDLAKETLARLTFGPAYEGFPVWTPDNKYVIFSSTPELGVGTGIFRKAADGTGAVETLTGHLAGEYPTMSISPDGKSLVFEQYAPKFLKYGLFVLPLEPRGEPQALLADPKFNAGSGRISPDGRWIAYDSDESGRTEVYVRPFPAVESGRSQISAEGGCCPFWSRSGRELFFTTSGSTTRLAAVQAEAGTSFTYSKPQLLFDNTGYSRFDISPDGKRFLTTRPVNEGNEGNKGNEGKDKTAARPSIVVVTHWFDEVKARMPAQR
jgi:Tol biopolymer transport system component